MEINKHNLKVDNYKFLMHDPWLGEIALVQLLYVNGQIAHCDLKGEGMHKYYERAKKAYPL